MEFWFELFEKRDEKGESWELEKIFDKSMKAHSRVIWNCCWLDNQTFLTAGRDKQLITWKMENGEWLKQASLQSDQALTAVDCVKMENSEESKGEFEISADVRGRIK